MNPIISEYVYTITLNQFCQVSADFINPLFDQRALSIAHNTETKNTSSFDK